MSKLKQMIGELRDRESDATKKVKHSLEIVEQMQMDKSQVFRRFFYLLNHYLSSPLHDFQPAVKFYG